MEKEFLERLTRIEEKNKTSSRRIDEHEERIIELEKTYAIMQKIDYRVGNVETTMKNINCKLDEATKKVDNEKSKKWDKFIDYLFYSIIGVMLAVVLSKLNLQ